MTVTTQREKLDVALSGVGDAHEVVESAKQRLDEARREVVRRLRDLRAEGPPSAELARELYWEHDELRVADLAEGFGVSAQGLRDLAGPVEESGRCSDCGNEMTLVKRSRSARPQATCPPCRRAMMGPSYPRGALGAWGPRVRSGPDLGGLLDHLERSMGPGDCDGSLNRTRAWAIGEGHTADAIVAVVRSHGGFCDCEVLHNVPDDRLPT